MLDLDLIREKPEEVRRSVERRGAEVDVDRILVLDKKRRSLIEEVEELRAQKNKISEAGGKPGPEQIKKAKRINKELDDLEPELEQVEEGLEELLLSLPNLLHPNVPEGKDENDNVVLKKWGEPKEFSFEVKDHLEIGEALDIIDTEKSAEVSGARFNYLKGEAVLLQFALVFLVLEKLTDADFIKEVAESVGVEPHVFRPVVPPMMMRSEVMKKMARLEPLGERYYLPKDKMVLVGSAEHTLGPLHMGEILSGKDLPLRYIGYSTSFRREAGSYGKDTRGILRVHQFDKLEMETFSRQGESVREQDFLVAIQESLMQMLGIPYQLVMICSGDMGDPDYRQMDIEAWLPGQNKYRETHTADLMLDYQARRLNTRYRDKKGELRFVHMNDATAFAVGRTLIAILENYQQEDGSVKVPEVLEKYVGFDKIGPR